MTLRNKFSDDQIKEALACNKTMKDAAKDLTDLGYGKVSPQLLHYWSVKLDSNNPTVVNTDVAKTEAQKRTAQVENNRLRKITRDVLDAERTKDELLAGIEEAVSRLNTSPATIVRPKPTIKGTGITLEILFSDLQIGKLMSDYNTEVAIKRLQEYSEVVLQRIYQYEVQGYNVEKIVFAMLGDIIESDKKHANSGRACDTGTATQLADSIEHITRLVIEPLSILNIPMDVVCITGNHDWDGHGLTMFKPGKEQLSYPMYKAMALISQAKGHDHVNWIIPDGSFHVHDIYGTGVLYEHGVGVSASEASMRKRMGDRIKQVKKFITLFRMGDKHNICRFNNDTMVVNGAFFGDDREGTEYSGISGYDGYPAQIMFAHVEREDDYRTTIFDSFAIQLGHIK